MPIEILDENNYEDFALLWVRKDQHRYTRGKDLLTMNEELKKVRKIFDKIKYVGEYYEYNYLLPNMNTSKFSVIYLFIYRKC